MPTPTETLAVFSQHPTNDRTESFMITMFTAQGEQYWEGVCYKRPETTWDDVRGEAQRQFIERSIRGTPAPVSVLMSKGKENILLFTLGF